MKKIMLLLAIALLCKNQASTQITINIVTPAANAAAGTNMLIEVEVTSTFQIASVVADVSGRQDTLVYNSVKRYFTGNISLEGMNQGTYQLNVSAKDVYGNQQNAVRSFIFDNPPTLTIHSPLNNSVARPLLPVVLSWDDLDSCRVAIYWQDKILYNAIHRDTLNLNLNLAAYQGTTNELTILVLDSRNQYTQKVLRIFVDSSSNLIEHYVSNDAIRDF